MIGRRLLAGAAAVVLVGSLSALAQRSDNPVLGIIYSGDRGVAGPLMAALREGMAETGYIDGQNVHVEYRWADGRYERLPALAAELVGLRVAVIAATGGENAPLAAKAATSTVPIVFTFGGDPVATGLVASLARPGGNLTGVTIPSFLLASKRVELFHELLPAATKIGMLANPNNSNFRLELRESRSAAVKFGLEIQPLRVADSADLDIVFGNLAEDAVDTFITASDGFLFGQSEHIVDLAERNTIPGIYFERQFVTAGGLMSFGSRLPDAYRQVGVYIGKILHGAKPADLPVQQPTKVELVINRRAARALGLTVSPSLVARADEVIE